MKKLLSILSSFLIVSSTILTVVACGTIIETKDPEPELPIIKTIDSENYTVYGETYEEWQEIITAYKDAKEEAEKIYEPIGDPPKNPSLEYYNQQQAGIHEAWYILIGETALIYSYMYENDLDINLYENNKFDLENFSKDDLQYIANNLNISNIISKQFDLILMRELNPLFAEYGDANDEYNYNERFFKNFITPIRNSYEKKLNIIEKYLYFL
ncbi:lipoprotein [Spiroplasma endosymbiont of Anurida maritima]|uniref:lipoprotein n=1 Tax=Spiroplasma endosymbiont of Anurida maritima TaxID=2967972 RepID=UPI0036D39725